MAKQTTPLVQKWGRNLRSRRTELGLTQAELAGRVGVQPQVISYWETGTRWPSPDATLLLTHLLGLDDGRDLFPLRWTDGAEVAA